MKVSIFGMGYVGAVSGACFASMGHRVIGVDTSAAKVETINSGGSPVIEAGVAERTAEARQSGNISATCDAMEAVLGSEISLISVGTPSAPGGEQSFEALDSVISSIGEALGRKSEAHTVVVRSTVLPGVTEERIAPRLEAASGRRLGNGLALCFNPEFLREGSAVKDFFNPPMTVIGGVGQAGCPQAEALYSAIEAPVFSVSAKVAETVKYASNAYHAVKITFANELGALFKASGIDSRETMRLFCEDRDLNISPAYLRPGFAFGGSCLPKELRAIGYLAKRANLDLPMMTQVLNSNERHIDRAFDMISRRGRRKVALFGLAFKPGTDDLRESPLVSLAERLIGKGYELAIFDQSLELARLTGTNLEYIQHEIPHLDRLLGETPEIALKDAETIVVGHAPADALAAIVKAGKGRAIIDLQGIQALQDLPGADYEGICW